MKVINDEVIDAIGRQLEPVTKTMSMESRKAFQEIIADLSRKELEAVRSEKLSDIAKDLISRIAACSEDSALYGDLIDRYDAIMKNILKS